MTALGKAIQYRRGFSAIEIMTVLGLVGLMISLLLPAVQNVRGTAARMACANTMKQLALALHQHEASHGRFPGTGRTPNDTDSLLSWMVRILPYLEHDELYRTSLAACAKEIRPYRNPPHLGYATPISSLVCPADVRLLAPQTTLAGDRAAFGSYLGIRGTFPRNPRPQLLRGVLGNPFGTRTIEIQDGTSNTLMVGERPPPNTFQAGRWYSGRYILEAHGGPDILLAIPNTAVSPFDTQCRLAGSMFGPGVVENPCDRFHYWSLHRGGANFAMADASVRFFRHSAAQLLPSLASMAGGEVVNIPD
jgi:prepilin-type processing-associated H-X9-DG protein